MKKDKPLLTAQAERDMLQVLQAERDAENTIRNCEQQSRQLINDVQIRVQRINKHVDQRITNMEMRHGHKLNRLINNIENEAAAKLSNDAGQHYDSERLHAVIKKLAGELCLKNVTPDDEAAPEK